MPRLLSLLTLFVGTTSVFLGYIFLLQQHNMAASNEVPPLNSPCEMVHTPLYETKKTDVFTKGASHMALIHNAILRGFNSIYQQAPHVEPSDYPSFIGYSLAWFHFVKAHHDDEETSLFPVVEKVIGKPDIWSDTHAEHEAFLGGLGQFDAYLSKVQSEPATFDGKKLVAIMDDFLEPFNHHFHSEIKTIAALSDLGDHEEAASVFKNWGKATVTKSGYTEGVPFLFLNFDRSFEDGMWENWPPMPVIIRNTMTRIGSAWHWSWWKFASCDVNGKPKALYALPNSRL